MSQPLTTSPSLLTGHLGCVFHHQFGEEDRPAVERTGTLVKVLGIRDKDRDRIVQVDTTLHGKNGINRLALECILQKLGYRTAAFRLLCKAIIRGPCIEHIAFLCHLLRPRNLFNLDSTVLEFRHLGERVEGRVGEVICTVGEVHRHVQHFRSNVISYPCLRYGFTTAARHLDLLAFLDTHLFCIFRVDLDIGLGHFVVQLCRTVGLGPCVVVEDNTSGHEA